MAAAVLFCCVMAFEMVVPTSAIAGVGKDHNFRSKRSFEISNVDIPRGGRKCHDLCNYMSHMCRNGGTCVIDQRTCEGRCACSPGWSGKWCKDRIPEEELSDGDTKLLANVLGRDILSDFSKIISNRTERVTEGETEEKNFGNTFATRIPSFIKSTRFLPDLSTKHSSKNPHDDSEGRNRCQKTCQNGDCYNIYGEYKCKPRVDPSDSSAPKVCGPGFKCDHGICDLEALKNNSYSCICESNYVGQFCTHKCPIDCGEHGFCDLNVADNTYKCIKSTRFIPDHTTKPSLNSTLNPHDDSEGRTRCQKTCQNGDCYNIYGEYKCKPRVDPSDSSAPKVCGPGFKCDHGICDLEALKNNSYDCICESNYVGQFCTHKCPLDCGEYGFCDLHVSDNTYKCFCQWNYTGLNCSELVPLDEEIVQDQEDIVFHWYVVGVSMVIVLLVLASMFLGAYFMWRKRLVFMLKIVHYFQQYEDDDGKEFDAFISYKSTPEDEAFVLHQLYPRLEAQLNFKLCLHFRDFIPGEAIANNIVRAIESSRRTIMVLSPAYVKSEWCRMEYQKAQHEMLKLKHKIIPIVLDDVSDLTNVDKNLKTILNSVTYIEWPGPQDSKGLDKFWKKLELSMPKRSNNSFSGYSESNSDSLCSNSSSGLPSTISRVSDENSETEIKHLTSVRRGSSPRVQKSKKKDFKHFMDKLVQNKLFNRQDSNSSQAALVDEETVASRSSCDSVSESVFTESSDSACSTPVTAHTYLSEVDENQEINNVFFTGTSRRVSHSKENLLQLCEKDHCEGTNCTACLKMQKYGVMRRQGSGRYVNRGLDMDDDIPNSADCRYCKRSDYNRVRISALEGEKLKIQRLLVDTDQCVYCRHPLSRFAPYRGSAKEHKDAANMKLQKRSRVNSLPRNYKRTAELARREVTLDIDSLEQEVSDSLGHFYIDVCEDV